MLLNGLQSFGGSGGNCLKIAYQQLNDVFEKSIILETFIETFFTNNNTGTENLLQALNM